MIFTTIIITTTTINRRIMLPELEFLQAGVAQEGYAARCDSPDQENDEQDDNDDAENDDDVMMMTMMIKMLHLNLILVSSINHVDNGVHTSAVSFPH